MVLRAKAVPSGCYVVSSNRPAPTPDGLIGGPSIAISPTSEVLLETTDPLSVVTLSREAVERARADYPGYLKSYPELYARAWSSLGEKDSGHQVGPEVTGPEVTSGPSMIPS